MSDPFFLLVLLGIIGLVITLVGHGLWLIAAALLNAIFGLEDNASTQNLSISLYQHNCDNESQLDKDHCVVCGKFRLTGLLADLSATGRQLRRFYRASMIDESVYTNLVGLVDAEHSRLTNQTTTVDTTLDSSASNQTWPEAVWQSNAVESSQPDPYPSAVVDLLPVDVDPAPSFLSHSEEASENEQEVPPSPDPIVVEPRRRFSEVLNAFMEESNIRWGEVIGGLLIIGCSTALVVSLWAQISQIPVLKFLIFTTVTAILFGIGLYTEHRWKLPNTSRGILTIATLLVPLNFLAIAAVSSGTTSGALVIGSEVLAPAIFLSLVYYAGRVITPGCASLLSSGILLSSIGQLLIRHFGSAELSPEGLLALAAFPIVSYVAAVSLALRNLLLDSAIDEGEARTSFTMLGTMGFAAALPFGLLLYKAGPVAMTMMYVAPIVTLWGLPLFITGAVLWRRILDSRMVASRTTGTVLTILGAMIVLAGVLLAWPNPGSIVPAALLSFAVFTAVALILDLPIVHLIASICLTVAYTVVFQVLAGLVPWTNLRVLSLWNVSLSAETGQALVAVFAVLVIASEWFRKLNKRRDSLCYLSASLLVMAISLELVTVYGLSSTTGPYQLWLVYLCYALGTFWIAWRHKRLEFSWVGSALLFFSLTQAFAQILELSFPWQTALLAHASIAASVSILLSRRDNCKVISKPLSQSALAALVFGVVCLFQANTWQVTDMQAMRVFWIAAIILLLLWNYHKHFLFVAFQVGTTTAVILTVKAALQATDWYTYWPFVFLHPRGLQIQATVLLLLGLVWIALRIACRRLADANAQDHWSVAAWRLLNTRFSIDRIISWTILSAFLLFGLYGAASGVSKELTALGSYHPGFNLAGYPREEVLGVGSWIVLALLILTMLAHSWERRRSTYLLAALVASTSTIPLLAGLFETQLATASAWRWLSIAFLVAGSFALWNRSRIKRALSWPSLNIECDNFAAQARNVLLIVTLGPLVLLTAYPALRAIFYLPVPLPASGFFSFLDIDFSYSFPFGVVGLVLIGYAIRERRADYALAGGLSLNLAVTIAYLFSVVVIGGLMDRIVLVRLLQLNAIVSGLYMLGWLRYRRNWQTIADPAKRTSAQLALKIQLGFIAALNVLLILPGVGAMVLSPEQVGPGTFAAGSLASWIALTIFVTALVWLRANTPLSAGVLTTALAGLVGLCALTLADVNIEMLSGLHCLTVSATVMAWLLFLASTTAAKQPLARFTSVADSWRSKCIGYAAVTGTIAAGLALRPALHDPAGEWWVILPLLALCGLAGAMHCHALKRRYLVAAAVLFNTAGSVWWLSYVSDQLPGLTAFIEANIAILSLSGILCLWLELRARRLSTDFSSTTILSLHHVIAILSSLILTTLVLVDAIFYLGTSPLLYFPRLGWLAFLSTLMLFAACVWDRHAAYAVGGIYLLGWVGCALLLEQLALEPIETIWVGVIFIALQTLLSALLWRWRDRVMEVAANLGIPRRIDGSVVQLNWLQAFNITAVCLVVLLAFGLGLHSKIFELRVSAAIAVLVQTITLGLLGAGSERARWLRAAVAMFIIGIILLGWSWLIPGSTATWLNRAVIASAAAFALTTLFTLVLNRFRFMRKDWSEAINASVPYLIATGVAGLFVCIGIEVSYQLSFKAVRLNWAAFSTLAVTLVSAAVLFLVFALSRTRDPLQQNERGRMTYVYASEIMLAALFVHLRLTMPWLFGSLEPYWPFVVMAIAYAGIIISESLRVRRLHVIARPVEITGMFLPLLPLIGFWIMESEVDYSVLLFVGGGLYGLLSLFRRSFRFGVVAAVCGNAGLWYYLQRTEGYQFLQHPQFWLVPVALSVLIAAYLNRDDFTDDQMATTRYMSLITIYISSTADIVINGVANSPWLPLILAAFSLAGVFSGIILRIRGMLLLSSLFLLLSIVTMIWYASVNFGWTWLWYVAGIVTGATIIFMFAVFEKKRSEVLRVVEGFRDWENRPLDLGPLSVRKTKDQKPKTKDQRPRLWAY